MRRGDRSQSGTADTSEPLPADEAIAELLNSMTGGQYLMLAEAIRRTNGEPRIPAAGLRGDGVPALPPVEVNGTDGVVVLGLMNG